MKQTIKDDPLRGLSEKQIESICRDYQNRQLTTREVAANNKIGKDRLLGIVQAKGLEPRGERWHLNYRRNRGRVSALCSQQNMDDALENAKMILRRRGAIVYDATVTDGAKGKGLIRVDNKRMTRADVLLAAQSVQR